MPDLTYAHALRDLRSLNVGSAVLDGDGDEWHLTSTGWSCLTVDGANTKDMDASSLAILTPITVIRRTTADVEIRRHDDA
ncbi:hypothetical protein ACFVWL_10245 [Microbacterium sp. NPDC058269]|uniref:hypothetical protein n=1 Tax=Microbacterium sp. NPDC058269 TaxID=3346414 RepID=UPI0036DB870E